MIARLCTVLVAVLLTLLVRPASAQGVSDSEIVIGMSAAFSGPSRALGIELYRGSHAYFEWINEQGGVHGRRIVIKAYDDGYDPPRAIANTIRLIEDDHVFLLFNYVGTPTVTRVLPLLRQFSGEHVFLFFPFTGAEPHRQLPYSEFVFNLRASYFNETEGLVSHFINIGRSDIAVFYQADAYGRSGWEGVRNALVRQGLSIKGEATYRRGSGFDGSFARQVEVLKAADPDAIVSVCSYEACAGIIRDIRASGWDVPIANLSFVASEAMATLLLDAEDEASYTSNLINAQVVPSYEDLSLPAVQEYREIMGGLGPDLPPAAGDSDYQPLPFSFVSFEGYLNARLLVEILQRLGPEPAKRRLLNSVEGMRNIDLGIDNRVFFGPYRHQASDAVYYTTLIDGDWVPLENWLQWKVDRP